MQLKRSTVIGKVKIILNIFFITQFILLKCYAEDNEVNEKFAELNILDKVSSKTSNIKVEVGKKYIFQNLVINILKCRNSKFDDDPEITAYMQVQDVTLKNNDQVFIFNGWTFASSTTLNPIDHPIYDLWLVGCGNS